MTPEKLLLLDYSGTLSLAAPRFGRPEPLARALADTGLADRGIATPAVFWQEIVDPTWREGSTTPVGYGTLLARRIARLRPAAAADPEGLAAAAQRFVAAYLAASPIDPLWRPVLARIAAAGRSINVIATDHYGEATAAIVGHLQALGLVAAPPGAGFPAPFSVANSADLGAWKAERPFWERLRERIGGVPLREVLLVDDFGRNETAGDPYSGRAAAQARQAKTLALLEEVFGVPAAVFPFFLEGAEDDQAARRLVAACASRIETFLAGTHPEEPPR